MHSSPFDRLSVLGLIALVMLALTPWIIAAYGFKQLLSD
jgi:hypothetical protein